MLAQRMAAEQLPSGSAHVPPRFPPVLRPRRWIFRLSLLCRCFAVFGGQKPPTATPGSRKVWRGQVPSKVLLVGVWKRGDRNQSESGIQDHPSPFFYLFSFSPRIPLPGRPNVVSLGASDLVTADYHAICHGYYIIGRLRALFGRRASHWASRCYENPRAPKPRPRSQ